MSSSDIILVIISGLGTVHGLFLALFLWGYSKGSRLSNRLLSLLLLILAFRIGKSVFLEFSDRIAVELIFTGLGSMLAIGPLFYFFVKSCCLKDFTFKTKYLIHFVPTLVGVAIGLWLDEEALGTLPKLFFVFLFLGYYGHFLTYLIISFSFIHHKRNTGGSPDTIAFLKLLNVSLLAIWFVYFLNLIEDQVPYIIGPILYSAIAYAVSFIVIRNGYLQNIHKQKYSTTSASEAQTSQLFHKVVRFMEEEKQFKNTEISLKSLSADLKVTPQILSMTINQKTGMNFNAFINHYRVEEAARLLLSSDHKNYTISSIAYEVGFNSISSFNTNFKTQTGKKPAEYRKS